MSLDGSNIIRISTVYNGMIITL